jgi:hypothetical protein
VQSLLAAILAPTPHPRIRLASPPRRPNRRMPPQLNPHSPALPHQRPSFCTIKPALNVVDRIPNPSLLQQPSHTRPRQQPPSPTALAHHTSLRITEGPRSSLANKRRRPAGRLGGAQVHHLPRGEAHSLSPPALQKYDRHTAPAARRHSRQPAQDYVAHMRATSTNLREILSTQIGGVRRFTARRTALGR